MEAQQGVGIKKQVNDRMDLVLPALSNGIDLLIDHGCNPNYCRPVTGETALHFACLQGQKHTTEVITVENGKGPGE